MKCSLFVCLVFISNMCVACLNEEHVTKSGKVNIDVFSLKGLTFYKSQNIAEIEGIVKRLLADKPVTDDEKRADKNDIAVNYIKLGRLDEAESILLDLIKNILRTTASMLTWEPCTNCRERIKRHCD